MPTLNPKYRLIGLALALLLSMGSVRLTAAPAAPTEPAATPAVAAAATQSELAIIEAWRQSADPKALPVENMTMPVAHHDNGRVRALLKAERALIPATDSGYIRAQNVVVEIFDTEGRVEGILITDNCFFDRATGAGYCEGKVRLEQRGVRIRGVDMVWNMNDHNAKILTQPEVRFDRFIKGIGELFK